MPFLKALVTHHWFGRVGSTIFTYMTGLPASITTPRSSFTHTRVVPFALLAKRNVLL